MVDGVTVQIAVDVPLRATFSYLAPQSLSQGQRVKVSFGRRYVCGIVVNEEPRQAIALDKLKVVSSILSGVPALPASFLAMTRFASTYYHYPFGQTLFTALPTSLRVPKNIILPDHRAYALTTTGRVMEPSARQRARHRLWAALHTAPHRLAELRDLTAQAPRLLSEWTEQGWVERVDMLPASCQVSSVPVLNTEQQSAVAAIAASLGDFCAWVLQGVTGSGKTEVYLRLIEAVLQQRQQVLVLVPEINLTPQLIARFTCRFPTTILALLHSHLADGERLRAWCDAWQGRAGIIIGTRMAVFVPLPCLGLIIVDEEHDGSFKQQDGLRYHARDLAVWRAKQENVPIVLGSATPSLETMANLNTERYRRLVLHRRAHESASLPVIQLVDTRHLKRVEGLTSTAVDALHCTLARGEMSLVYINRRGFSPVLACIECGWVSGCQRCSARLVLHLIERKLRCHHCGWEETVPNACPSCGNVDIKPLGEGTQRLEAGLLKLFPSARVLRIDRDTTQRKGAWDAIYERVQRGEVDILVGTQMLAKGHDFGALSLAVVLNADSGLYSADYRAAEWLFSQLIQVAGRAGRAGVPGNVLVQTKWPDHPLYQALMSYDFDGFCEQLLTERCQAGFPPYTYQAILRADAASLPQGMVFLHKVKQAIDREFPGVLLSGPAPALMVRLANRERAQLVLESVQRQMLHRCVDQLVEVATTLGRRAGKGVRWSVDVDPHEF